MQLTHFIHQDKLIRLANELQVSGFNETCLEKRRKASETNQKSEICTNFTNLINGNAVHENDGQALHLSTQSASGTSILNIGKEPEVEKTIKNTPEEILKSSKKFNNWLVRLSSKISIE